jgi:hypothetical protein
MRSPATLPPVVTLHRPRAHTFRPTLCMCSYVCLQSAKCLLFFSSLFLLLGVAFYVVIGIVGVIIDSPEVQNIQEEMATTCQEYTEGLSSATDEGEACQIRTCNPLCAHRTEPGKTSASAY